jgi:RimJ/RimL family protein N-acetyltransferase
LFQQEHSVEIRRLTEADTPIYWPLRLRALREEPEAFGGSYEEQHDLPLEVPAARLRAAEQAPDNAIFGAFDESGQLVGTIGLQREQGAKNRHKAVLWGVYVVPEARGQELGSALLQTALDFGRQIKGVEQVLLAVASKNAAARALYLAAGFEPWGLEPLALKLDDHYIDEEHMILFLQ